MFINYIATLSKFIPIKHHITHSSGHWWWCPSCRSTRRTARSKAGHQWCHVRSGHTCCRPRPPHTCTHLYAGYTAWWSSPPGYSYTLQATSTNVLHIYNIRVLSTELHNLTRWMKSSSEVLSGGSMHDRWERHCFEEKSSCFFFFFFFCKMISI